MKGSWANRFLAQALGHAACRAGHRVLFIRADRLGLRPFEIEKSGYRPCRRNRSQESEPKSLIAAFCCLAIRQAVEEKKDVAEACGSRTHHPPREGTDRRL